MPSRATPLPPQERRVQLEQAAVQVLLSRGLAATTKEIAAAAGVAEGTIFRVFDSKDDLVHAALCRAFDPSPLVERLEGIDRSLPLRSRLVELVTALHERFVAMFDLMNAVGMIRPPEDVHHRASGVDAPGEPSPLACAMVALVETDADQLSVEPEHLVRLLRLLTFAGSNQHIARGQLLTPAQVVDALLDGTRKAPPC